jgi:hypothetical protein
MKMDFWQDRRARAEVLECGLKVLKGNDGEFTRYTLQIWKPKALKPFANYYFRDEIAREKYILEQVEAHKRHLEHKKEVQAARKPQPEQLESVKPGHIFVSSWGYEQTNVDFYEVVSRSGQTVTVREISQRVAGTETGNGMADYRLPVAGSFCGEPFKKRLNFWRGQAGIKISSFQHASTWNGQEMYCSWYA